MSAYSSQQLPRWLSGKKKKKKKSLPAYAEAARDAGLIPGSGKSPGDSKATHSSILAWEIPWTEEPGRLKSMVAQTDMTE